MIGVEKQSVIYYFVGSVLLFFENKGGVFMILPTFVLEYVRLWECCWI